MAKTAEQLRTYHREYQRNRRAGLRAELERVRSLSVHDRIVARILAIPVRPSEPEAFRCEPCECGGHPECPSCEP